MIPAGVVNQISFVPGQFESTAGTLSNGNRTWTASGSGWARIDVNRPKTTGKWFFAVELGNVTAGSTSFAVGTANAALGAGSGGYIPTNPGELRATSFHVGKKTINAVTSNYGVELTSGMILGIGYDADTGSVTGYIYSSGWVSEGIMATIASGTTRKPTVLANLTASTQFNCTLRSDLSTPAGYQLWA